MTVLSTPFDVYQIDGDAVGYMDISDYILGRHWSLVVNGYWHPLYPAVLALGQRLFHTTRATELSAFYWMSDAIFLLEILSMVAFVGGLCRVRARLAGGASNFLLGTPALQFFGLGLLVIAAQRELSPGKIRPDALLQALLLLGVAGMARYLATDRLRYAALMGASLGLAYLTKSFALAFMLSCVLILVVSGSLLLRHSLRRIAISTVVVLLCFGVIAGPYIAALSKQHHRLDMGDSGALNYAWFIGNTEKMHLEPWMKDSFGTSAVHLAHPEKQLLADPPVYSFRDHPGGTYPPWFDPAYFNEGVVPHAGLMQGVPHMARNVVLALRYVFDHLEGWIVLTMFAACGVPLLRRSRERKFALPFVATGLAVWGIYGLVNVEQRYVTVGYLMFMLPLFASLQGAGRAGERDDETGGMPRSGAMTGLAAAVVMTMALLAAGESVRLLLIARRMQSIAKAPGGWYNADVFSAGEALRHIGLQNNAAIGCIGRSACLIDTYTSRLAGVHITSEIYMPEEPVQNFIAREGAPKMQIAADVMRREGAEVILGSFDLSSPMPVPSEWHRLGGSSFFYLDLRDPSILRSSRSALVGENRGVAGL